MEPKVLSTEQLEEYYRAMAAQYETDAQDTSSTFAREYEDWKRIRNQSAGRQVATDNQLQA